MNVFDIIGPIMIDILALQFTYSRRCAAGTDRPENSRGGCDSGAH